MANFQSVLEEARTLVKENLANRDRCPSYMSEKQLTFILDELAKRSEGYFFKRQPKKMAGSVTDK